MLTTRGYEVEELIFDEEEYFYPWRDIWPEKNREYTPPLGKERQQELLVQGMLPQETLLDIVRTCTVFPSGRNSSSRMNAIPPPRSF